MADCKICKHNYKYPFLDCEPKCNCMCENYSDFEAITNADRIRAMSDEELADMLIHLKCDHCGVWATSVGLVCGEFEKVREIEQKWLKQPADKLWRYEE